MFPNDCLWAVKTHTTSSVFLVLNMVLSGCDGRNCAAILSVGVMESSAQKLDMLSCWNISEPLTSGLRTDVVWKTYAPTCKVTSDMILSPSARRIPIDRVCARLQMRKLRGRKLYQTTHSHGPTWGPGCKPGSDFGGTAILETAHHRTECLPGKHWTLLPPKRE